MAQLVRAPPCHGGGRRFESDLGRRKSFWTDVQRLFYHSNTAEGLFSAEVDEGNKGGKSDEIIKAACDHSDAVALPGDRASVSAGRYGTDGSFSDVYSAHSCSVRDEYCLRLLLEGGGRAACFLGSSDQAGAYPLSSDFVSGWAAVPAGDGGAGPDLCFSHCGHGLCRDLLAADADHVLLRSECGRQRKTGRDAFRPRGSCARDPASVFRGGCDRGGHPFDQTEKKKKVIIKESRRIPMEKPHGNAPVFYARYAPPAAGEQLFAVRRPGIAEIGPGKISGIRPSSSAFPSFFPRAEEREG